MCSSMSAATVDQTYFPASLTVGGKRNRLAKESLGEVRVLSVVLRDTLIVPRCSYLTLPKHRSCWRISTTTTFTCPTTSLACSVLSPPPRRTSSLLRPGCTMLQRPTSFINTTQRRTMRTVTTRGSEKPSASCAWHTLLHLFMLWSCCPPHASCLFCPEAWRRFVL